MSVFIKITNSKQCSFLRGWECALNGCAIFEVPELPTESFDCEGRLRFPIHSEWEGTIIKIYADDNFTVLSDEEVMELRMFSG